MSHKKKERPSPESLHLPLTGADAHAHLDFDESESPTTEAGLLAGILERAAAAGVRSIAQFFVGLRAYAGRTAFPDSPDLVFCLGVHPQDAGSFTGADLEGLRAAFNSDPRLRAVGEIGLDFYGEHDPALIQEEVFRLQLRLAKELDKPVVIHSRDAAESSLRLLEEEGFAGRPLLWHCFSGDAVPHVDRIVGNGWHCSIPGPVTYPANQPLRDAVARIPGDRLLLESDCPYLAPLPWRGTRNEPALTAFTAVTVAEIHGRPVEEIWALCGRNMRRFYGMAED